MSMLDAGLLRRFFHSRDEEAFRELVRRHGPAVMAICRRQLNDDADAEDAYQLTFITLAKRAETIRAEESIRGWLCKVAYRVCINIQEKKAARRTHESHASARPHHEPAEWERIERLLDHEVSQLPEDYRLAIWYCCLQGMTREETAEMLRLTPGQVKGRLERGRQMLREQLRQRGIDVPSVVVLGYLQVESEKSSAAPLLSDTIIRRCMEILPPVGVAATIVATVGTKMVSTGVGLSLASTSSGIASSGVASGLAGVTTGATGFLGLGGLVNGLKILTATGLVGLATFTTVVVSTEPSPQHTSSNATTQRPDTKKPKNKNEREKPKYPLKGFDHSTVASDDDDGGSIGGSVPEPGTAVLLGFGSLALLRRRRR